MSISVRNILKHSSKFTGANFLSKIIGFPISIIVAMILTPEDYGYIGYVSVFISYAAFVHFGMFSAAVREMPGLIKSGKLSRALYLQNLAISTESILALFVFLVLIIIAFIQKNPVIRIIFILSSIGFLITRFYSYLEGINFSFQEFSLSAKGRLIRVILYPILTLSLLFWLKIYTIPIVALLIPAVITIFFLRARSYNLSIIFNKKENVRLIKIGVILTIGSVLYTFFTQILDKTIIAAYLSKAELGLWFFSFNFVQLFLGMFKDFGSVLKPTIWGFASNVPKTQDGFFAMRRMAIYFSLFTSFLIGFLQLGFLVLVNFVTVKFQSSQWVFLFIVLYIFWEAIEKFPEMILYSDKVNRQKTVMFIWGSCVVVNLTLDVLAIKLGYGIVGVAIATTISQIISTTLMYIFSSRYFFYNKYEFINFFKKLVFPFLITLLVTYLHWMSLKNGGCNLLILIPLSIFIQSIVWYLIFHFFYPTYVPSKKTIVYIYSSIKEKLKNFRR